VTRYAIDLLTPTGPITGTVEMVPVGDSDSQAVLRFLDGIDPKTLVLTDFSVSPAEAVIAALKEVAGGRS